MENKTKAKILKVSQIKFDEGLYPRSTWNWQTSYDYAESMKAGAKFPPIVVAPNNKGEYLILDGLHRFRAIEQLNKAKKKGNKDIYIQVEIIEGLTRNQMFEEAIKRNISHGRPFSPYEKRQLIVKLKDMGYAFDVVSQMIKIPLDRMEQFTYNTISTDFSTGKPIVVKALLKSSIGSGKLVNVNEDFNNNQSTIVHSKNQEMLLKELNFVLENNLLELENQRIIDEIQKLKLYLDKIKLDKKGSKKKKKK